MKTLPHDKYWNRTNHTETFDDYQTARHFCFSTTGSEAQAIPFLSTNWLLIIFSIFHKRTIQRKQYKPPLYAKKREKKKPHLLCYSPNQSPNWISYTTGIHTDGSLQTLTFFFSFCHYPSPIPPTPFSSQKLLSPWNSRCCTASPTSSCPQTCHRHKHTTISPQQQHAFPQHMLIKQKTHLGGWQRWAEPYRSMLFLGRSDWSTLARGLSGWSTLFLLLSLLSVLPLGFSRRSVLCLWSTLGLVLSRQSVLFRGTSDVHSGSVKAWSDGPELSVVSSIGGGGGDLSMAPTNFFRCLMYSGYSSRLQWFPPLIHSGSYFTLASSHNALPWEQSTTSSAVPCAKKLY